MIGGLGAPGRDLAGGGGPEDGAGGAEPGARSLDGHSMGTRAEKAEFGMRLVFFLFFFFFLGGVRNDQGGRFSTFLLTFGDGYNVCLEIVQDRMPGGAAWIS